jgi:hypothetical protein
MRSVVLSDLKYLVPTIAICSKTVVTGKSAILVIYQVHVCLVRDFWLVESLNSGFSPLCIVIKCQQMAHLCRSILPCHSSGACREISELYRRWLEREDAHQINIKMNIICKYYLAKKYVTYHEYVCYGKKVTTVRHVQSIYDCTGWVEIIHVSTCILITSSYTKHIYQGRGRGVYFSCTSMDLKFDLQVRLRIRSRLSYIACIAFTKFGNCIHFALNEFLDLENMGLDTNNKVYVCLTYWTMIKTRFDWRPFWRWTSLMGVCDAQNASDAF